MKLKGAINVSERAFNVKVQFAFFESSKSTNDKKYSFIIYKKVSGNKLKQVFNFMQKNFICNGQLDFIILS